MCGIAGFVTRDGTPPDAALLGRLRQGIAHRGPDADGQHVAGGVALLHARLSIVDLVTGDQPLFDADGRVLIVNGEIYNDAELRADLAGYEFRTGSDCEPVLPLYAAHGAAFARHLRGMFALALADPATGRVVLARDPFGIKPLYYAEVAGGLAFASEAGALLGAGLVDAVTDDARAAELLQIKFTTGADTIIPGIHRVLPGETLVVERGRVVSRHRQPGLPTGARRRGTVAQLGAVLDESVRAHLRSDVPYGLFLSGGIDSAALLALMTRAGVGRVQAITVGYAGGGDADESAEAERLARAAGAACERIVMTADDFWAYAPRIAAAIDDPTADAAVLPTWMLGRAAARAGLKVALCGEGGDEMFGGYSRYRRGRPPLAWLARKPRTRGVMDGLLRQAGGWRAGLDAAELAAARHGLTGVQRLQAIDCAEWLPNDLLVKLDRCLMAHGVEGRTPFVDPRVAAFAFALPDSQKVGARFGKILLRAWLAEAFPEAGAWARKRGFKPPVGRWMADRGDALARLVAAEPGVAAMVSAADVGRAFADAGRNSQRAWSLLFYALWHAHHIAGVPSDGDVAQVLGSAA